MEAEKGGAILLGVAKQGVLHEMSEGCTDECRPIYCYPEYRDGLRDRLSAAPHVEAGEDAWEITEDDAREAAIAAGELLAEGGDDFEADTAFAKRVRDRLYKRVTGRDYGETT